MPTKIRLQRKGKKGQPFYHIVIADGRAPREGRFIERIGTYNPLTKPADIDIDFEKTLDWVLKGAQPTDTVKAILHYKGVMYKAHLLKGVKKGALTDEQAEAKFQIWMNEKQEKINSKIKETSLGAKDAIKKQLAYEKEVNEKKSAEIAKKMAKAAATESREAAAEAQEEAHETEVAEVPVVEVPEAKIPEVEVPEVETPEVEVPEVEVPEVEVPEVEIPEVEVPEVEAPEVETPGTPSEETPETPAEPKA